MRLSSYMVTDSGGWARGPAACAEFPNDNPALHRGAIWRCTEVLGTLSCELPAPLSIPETVLESSHAQAGPAERVGFEVLEAAEPCDDPEDDEAAIEIVDDLDFDVDPFARLVDVLGDAARALGADECTLVGLRALFGLARADAIAPSENAAQALLAGQVLVRGAKGLTRANEFTSQVLAWQGVLRGESEDFGALGPLDEWAADVVARVVGNPARADGIRREIRRRGVAAFGIVADAA